MLRTVLFQLLIFSLLGVSPAETNAQTIEKNRDEVTFEYITKLLTQSI